MRRELATTHGIGIAIFVKTPGFSPIKTRLATALGQAAAETFHRLAAAAVAETAMSTATAVANAMVYWAVAEADALDAPMWLSLPCIAQGEGDLGARMRTVYERLRAQHGAAILIGADAPQIHSDDLQDACTVLRTHDTVIGPSEDGGFWLFGGRHALPDEAWSQTPWSQPDTRERFVCSLDPRPPISLRTLRDVDTFDDLHALHTALMSLQAPSSTQRELMLWLDTMLD